MHRVRLLVAAVAAALVLSGGAHAAGGNYVFAGGTAAQRAEVTAALNASSFNWSIVPQQITIHVARGTDSEATRGEIWIDADLVDSGRFAWGTIQHEYAHQVDFFLLTDEQRASASSLLGGTSWLPAPGVAHGKLTAERFASTLAWSYWQSNDNTMRPESKTDEAGALPPAQFRALLTSLLGPAATASVSRTTLSARPRSREAQAAAPLRR
jgi:hypothetical protein